MEIQLQADTDPRFIRIQGLPEDITAVLQDIQEIFQGIEQKENEKKEAEIMAKQVVDFMVILCGMSFDIFFKNIEKSGYQIS